MCNRGESEGHGLLRPVHHSVSVSQLKQACIYLYSCSTSLSFTAGNVHLSQIVRTDQNVHNIHLHTATFIVVIFHLCVEHL